MNKPGYYFNTEMDTFFIIYPSTKVEIYNETYDLWDLSGAPHVWIKIQSGDEFLGPL